MPGTAAKITITERQQGILKTISGATTAASRLRQRAKIILLSFEGWFNEDIAELVGLERHQVAVWRWRWRETFDRMVLIECGESAAALRREIEAVLSDAPRPGAPAKFTPEQLVQLVAIACEPPENSGRPISHWTARELADELMHREIVAEISPSHVGRFLAEAQLQPHKVGYWLDTTEKDPELFAQQVQQVCATYQEAPELYHVQNTHTVSVDEKTGIQALERSSKTLPMRSGKIERVEFEYERHGTQCLIANFHVVTGEILAPTVQETRTEADFVRHMEQTVATDPTANWVFVMDNLNIHLSATLVEWVAEKCGLDMDLGVKGKKGILESVDTRRDFLTDPSHRIRIVYTPKHSSWLNQIEIWFGILTRKLLKRASFPSVEKLRERILEFIDYFNKTMAKPFRWTYTGRPLQAGTR